LTMTEIDALLQENRKFLPPNEFKNAALLNDSTIYDQDVDAFWASEAEKLQWFTKWKTVSEWTPPHSKWFVGGKINISVNCLDRRVGTKTRDKAAFLWEGEPGDQRKLTYGDVYVEVQKFANVLKSLGVKRGDRVSIYMPLIPEVAIAMLACTRIGAIHSVV